MWSTEHSIAIEAAPDTIWRSWTEVERWPEWNTNVERSELQGTLAIGGTIVMKPRGQEQVELRIVDLSDGEWFADEADFDGTVVRIIHRIDKLEGERVAATLRLEAEGKSAEQLGAAISSDFPAALGCLARHAQRQT